MQINGREFKGRERKERDNGYRTINITVTAQSFKFRAGKRSKKGEWFNWTCSHDTLGSRPKVDAHKNANWYCWEQKKTEGDENNFFFFLAYGLFSFSRSIFPKFFELGRKEDGKKIDSSSAVFFISLLNSRIVNSSFCERRIVCHLLETSIKTSLWRNQIIRVSFLLSQ